MLEVARECLEDAGVTDDRGQKMDAILTASVKSGVKCLLESLRIGVFTVSLATGTSRCPIVVRTKWTYEGRGVSISSNLTVGLLLTSYSMTIRTACSASLVALHEACVAISRGDCDSAIVGGANLIMSPGATMSMTEQNVLSPDGSCKSFPADANGYARGEAITAVYIKRLDNALSDRDPIRAVIRGTATNHAERPLN